MPSRPPAEVGPREVAEDDNLWSAYVWQLHRADVCLTQAEADREMWAAFKDRHHRAVLGEGVRVPRYSPIPNAGWADLDRDDRTLVAAWTWPNPWGISTTSHQATQEDCDGATMRHRVKKQLEFILYEIKKQHRELNLEKAIAALMHHGQSWFDGTWREDEPVVAHQLLRCSELAGLRFAPHAGWSYSYDTVRAYVELVPELMEYQKRQMVELEKWVSTSRVEHDVVEFHKDLPEPPTTRAKYRPLFDRLDDMVLSLDESGVTLSWDEIDSLLE